MIEPCRETLMKLGTLSPSSLVSHPCSRRILPMLSGKQPPDPQWDQPPHLKLDQARMIH